MKHVYVIATTSRNKDQDLVEFNISQEAYDTLEKAQKFCESRWNVYQIDDMCYAQIEEDDTGWIRTYNILVLEVK